MKICFVTTNFPRYPGDSEGTFVWEAVRAVIRHGHQARVIAQHWPGWPTHERWDEVDIIRPHYWWPESGETLRSEGGGLPIAWRKSTRARLQMLPFTFVHTAAVARYARDCDVIHAQWTLSAAAARLSRPVHGCPIVVTLHGSDIFQAAATWWGARLARWVLKGCNSIVAVSQALRQATGNIGIDPEAITVIPDGVDLEQFTPSLEQRQPLLLYVGTLIMRKGVVYLLQAMPAIVQHYPSVRLVIVGDGPERPALETTVRDLNLTEHVSFVGFQSPDKVRHWMKQAKLFVLPSIEEGLGVVLLEALASGTPIIASQVGGIPEVVDHEVGRLVPPADPGALAKAVSGILADEDKWQAMSRYARQRAETHYGWSQVAARLVTIYEKSKRQPKELLEHNQN